MDLVLHPGFSLQERRIGHHATTKPNHAELGLYVWHIRWRLKGATLAVDPLDDPHRRTLLWGRIRYDPVQVLCHRIDLIVKGDVGEERNLGDEILQPQSARTWLNKTIANERAVLAETLNFIFSRLSDFHDLHSWAGFDLVQEHGSHPCVFNQDNTGAVAADAL